MSTLKGEHAKPIPMLLMAESFPTGDGNFIVRSKKPVREVPSVDAARILGVSRKTLDNIASTCQMIKWRWNSPRRGKRIFDLDSLLKYRAASADPEFGDHPYTEYERQS